MGRERIEHALDEVVGYLNGIDAAEQQENVRILAQEREPPSLTAPLPLDVFGARGIIGSPDFPLSLFPALFEDRAADVAERLGVDPAMVAMPMLTACAAAIDDRVKILPLAHDTSWTESARLWAAFIADSGEKKTPALKAALAPIGQVEREWREEDQARMGQYRDELAVFTEAQKLQRKAKARAIANGKEIDFPDLPNPPIKPPTRRKQVSDATVEALSEVMVDNTWGLLELHDELSGWFGNFDAYRNRASGKDRALYLEAYNGGPQLIDRVSRGRVYVPNWSLCLIGGIQPGPMQRLAGQITDDGLVQRFMVVFTRPGGTTVDRAENEDARIAYESLISRLLRWEIGGPDARILCRFEPEAHAIRELINQRVQHVRCMPWVSSAFHAHLAKWEGLFPRICLTWHIIEHGDELASLPREISASTAGKVAGFMLEYLLPHAARFYSEILQASKEESYARWIAGHILAHDLEKITARDIGRAFRDLRGKVKDIQQTMEYLVALSWVTPEDRITIGGPRKWTVNPAVHALFSGRAQQEKQDRERIIRKIQEAVSYFPALTGSEDDLH